MLKKYAIYTLVFLIGVFVIQAQERPKIGVVLSGGGAKGFAHIGVLKVLEEEGVKVDYIGGTSMGAIIGGLYASGYTANQLDSIFKTVDPDALLQDYIPRNSKAFHEKKNDEIYALQLPFNDFKLGMPQALSKGMYNYNLLSRLLGHVRYVNDFNKLPIPFLCVATDVVTGKQVVLDKGNLPQSILASGAFPSLYSPIEINDQILIDGGISNNFPVDEVRKMGADIIIGVDVQDRMLTKEEIKGATDVLMQIANYGMYKDMDIKIKNTDIYIVPDITKYSVVTFDKGEEIIMKGIEAAQQKLDLIKPLSSNYRKNELPSKYVFDRVNLSDIKVNNLKFYNKDYVLGKFDIEDLSNAKFSDIEEGINKLNGTQNFTAINYRFIKDGYSDKDLMFLNLQESPNYRFIKLGINYNDLYKTSVLLNVSQKKVFFRNDVASFDAILGDKFRYNFNYFIDNGKRWSFGVQSKLTRFDQKLESFTIAQQNPTVVDFSTFTNKLYLQNYYQFGFSGSIGLEHKFNKIDLANTKIDNNNYYTAYANLILDTYDNKYFPTKGLQLKADVRYTGLSDIPDFSTYLQYNLGFGYVLPLVKNLSLEFNSEIGSTVRELPNKTHEYFLGGYGFDGENNIKSFYGYNLLSLNGDSYAKILLKLDYRFHKNHHLNFSANFAHVENKLFESLEWFNVPKYTGYALGYGFQSIIGPIEIKQTFSPEVDKSYTWFSVGFWF